MNVFQREEWTSILRGSFLSECFGVGCLGGSVKQPTSAQVIILQFVSSSPMSGYVLTAQSLAPASGSLSPSLSASPPLVLCLSLSLKNKNKNKNKMNILVYSYSNSALELLLKYYNILNTHIYMKAIKLPLYFELNNLGENILLLKLTSLSPCSLRLHLLTYKTGL